MKCLISINTEFTSNTFSKKISEVLFNRQGVSWNTWCGVYRNQFVHLKCASPLMSIQTRMLGGWTFLWTQQKARVLFKVVCVSRPLFYKRSFICLSFRSICINWTFPQMSYFGFKLQAWSSSLWEGLLWGKLLVHVRVSIIGEWNSICCFSNITNSSFFTQNIFI